MVSIQQSQAFSSVLHDKPLLCLQGSVLLTRQVDQPGIVAGVSSLLAKDSVNISFMTVGRTGMMPPYPMLRSLPPMLAACCTWSCTALLNLWIYLLH